MTLLAFVDCETTALGPLARPWEVAVILRSTEELDVPDGEWLYQVEYTPSRLPDGTQSSALKVGGWGTRGWGTGASVYREALIEQDVATASGGEWTIADSLNRLLEGVVLIGVGPHFDAAVLSRMFRRHGLPDQPWHYAITDLKSATYGWAVARGMHPDLPMSSAELADLAGVEPARVEDRHTALGDARWAVRWWDALHDDPIVRGMRARAEGDDGYGEVGQGRGA